MSVVMLRDSGTSTPAPQGTGDGATVGQILSSLEKVENLANGVFVALAKKISDGSKINPDEFKSYNESADKLYNLRGKVLADLRAIGVKGLPEKTPKPGHFRIDLNVFPPKLVAVPPEDIVISPPLSGLGWVPVAVAAARWSVARWLVIGAAASYVAYKFSPATSYQLQKDITAMNQDFAVRCSMSMPADDCVRLMSETQSQSPWTQTVATIGKVAVMIGAVFVAYRLYVRYEQGQFPFNHKRNSGGGGKNGGRKLIAPPDDDDES